MTDHLAYLDTPDFELLVLDLEIPEPELPELTPSEREVAVLVTDGLSNAEIATKRGVAVRTIANQVRSIFQKLQVCSRWDLSLLLTRRSLERREPALQEFRFRPQRPSPADLSSIVNSPATVRVLRTAYGLTGVDFDETRERLGISYVGDGALDRQAYCDLFQELASLMGRADLGLALASRLPVGSLGLLEWLALTASSLGESLHIVSEHGGLLHAGGHRVTRAEGDELTVAYWMEGVATPRVLIDWSFGFLFECLRRTTGERLTAVEVRVQYDDPGDGRTEEFFGCPVRYNAARNELVVPRQIGAVKTPCADPEVFDALAGVARRRVVPRPPTLASRGLKDIRRDLEAGSKPERARLARRLGVSTTTLDRELALTGNSFEKLVAAARADHAVRSLEQRGAGLHEVAATLRSLGSRTGRTGAPGVLGSSSTNRR